MSLDQMTLEEKKAMSPRDYGRELMRDLLRKREGRFGRPTAAEFATHFLTLQPTSEVERGMDDACSEYLLGGVK